MLLIAQEALGILKMLGMLEQIAAVCGNQAENFYPPPFPPGEASA